MKGCALAGVIMVLLVLAACTSPQGQEGVKMNASKSVDNRLVTADGVRIAYAYANGSSNSNGVILLHQLGSNLSAYDRLFVLLAKKDVEVVRIDFRGHGESELNYSKFSEQDWQKLVYDVAAARKLLRAKTVSVVGASIGANVALNYAFRDSSVTKVVLLSPGLNYRGVDSTYAIERVKADILIFASEEDTYAFKSSEQLTKLNNRSTFMRFVNVGHGTGMFAKSDIEKRIVEFLVQES